MNLKKLKTWILVADGGQAHIYAQQQEGDEMPPKSKLVRVLSVQAEKVGNVYDFDPKRRGRVQESASPTRHGTEPHVTPREESKWHFAQHLADYLYAAQQKKSFQRLILVAPPKVLGELRSRLRKVVLKAVVAELPKDLTHFKVKALAEHLDSAA